VRLIRILAFGAVALALASVSAQSETGLLAGQVKDPSGAVLDHVQIAVQHLKRIAGDPHDRFQLKSDQIVSTDYDGRFNISLQPGDYIVLFVWQSFEPDVRRVRIEGGKKSTVRVQLKWSPLDKFVE
jgi:hypothetical protein